VYDFHINSVKGERPVVNAEGILRRAKVFALQRIDTAAIKKELPEIAERYTKTSEARRFKVA